MKIRNRFAGHASKRNSTGAMKVKRKNVKLERRNWKKILKSQSY